jgi:H+/Cl- antiporter ClcA
MTAAVVPPESPEEEPPGPSSRPALVATYAIGGLLGGLVGATTAVLVTQVIKALLAVVTRQETWVTIVVPLVGLGLSVLVLNGYRRGAALQRLTPETAPSTSGRPGLLGWRPTGRDVIRADLTSDVLANAGTEERFPYRLAPPRIVAIIATVGLGAPMGTESPAAHMGVAAGAFLGDRGRLLRRIARPAAVGGGAAGVAALIGNPLVGAAFILELGRRKRVPLSLERCTAALVGGLVGWSINVAFDLSLIRLNVPEIAPEDLPQALATAVLVGLVAGAVTSLTGVAIYRARGWQAPPVLRLVLGGLAVAAAATAVAAIASPAAAVGPGTGAAVWAETADAAAPTLLAVALLRAAATTAAVAAGGCGGLFVPFLAIGDVAGRALAPAFGVPSDLAGAAGAAGGIAGGYRLPFTAVALVLGLGGPQSATLTCLAAVGVATLAGVGAGMVVDRASAVRAARSGP